MNVTTGPIGLLLLPRFSIRGVLNGVLISSEVDAIEPGTGLRHGAGHVLLTRNCTLEPKAPEWLVPTGVELFLKPGGLKLRPLDIDDRAEISNSSVNEAKRKISVKPVRGILNLLGLPSTSGSSSSKSCLRFKSLMLWLLLLVLTGGGLRPIERSRRSTPRYEFSLNARSRRISGVLRTGD